MQEHEGKDPERQQSRGNIGTVRHGDTFLGWGPAVNFSLALGSCARNEIIGTDSEKSGESDRGELAHVENLREHRDHDATLHEGNRLVVAPADLRR